MIIMMNAHTFHVNSFLLELLFFRKQFKVPEHFEGKRLILRMERTRKSHVWIDGKYIGHNLHLSVPHLYTFEDGLSPGDT